jgi:hypothetical protein
VNIGVESFTAQRIAMALFYGEWPPAEVDHINGIRDDNRIVNLRHATRSQNSANTKTSTRNRSGAKGVSWCPVYQRWVARLNLQGRCVFCRKYRDFYDAVRAYDEAIVAHFGPFARTNASMGVFDRPAPVDYRRKPRYPRSDKKRAA